LREKKGRFQFGWNQRLPEVVDSEYDGCVSRPIVLLIVGLFACWTSGAPTQRADRTADLDLLIQSLAEPDPAARQAAADRLIALGADARPALLDALESDNPAIRAQAGELLQKLPWFREDDPAEVKEILAKYGSMEDGQRYMAAGRLATLADQAGYDALLRLATEEPSERVRWLIVGLLRDRSMYGPAKKRLQQLDENSPHAAIVLLAGWGWWQIDTARSHALLARAVDLESHNWRQPNDEMLAALNVLIDDAAARHDFERAVELTRQKIAFVDLENNPAADPHLELLALHAKHGPLNGLANDLRELSDSSGGERRELLYAAARMFQRWHCDPVSNVIASTALAAAEPKSLEDHMAVGDFLAGQKWYGWASAEYQAAVDLENVENESIIDAGILFRLSSIASEQERDAASADYLEQAMKLVAEADNLLLQRRGQGGSVADNAIWAQIHFKRFRAARQRNDDAEAAKHLNDLLALRPADIDIAIEVVPYLKEANRADDARQLFDATYTAFKGYCDEEPENPEHMNNLAWLCARSGERLDDALKLSTAAVAAAPENYAYLDTAAEANFRMGDAAKAVELEEKALTFRPFDPFMIEQLARFRAAP
jgi:hypothetical protein